MTEFAFEWDKSAHKTRYSHSTDPDHSRHTFSELCADHDLEVAGVWRADNASALIADLGLDHSDTFASILCAGWRAWGSDLARRLRGPFAIVIFDRAKQSLYAARDGLGIEPLYVAINGHRIALASSPKGARAACGLASMPNRQMIADFLRYRMTSPTATFHEGLERVAPGHWLTCDAGLAPVQERYYDLAQTPMTAPPTTPVAHFRQLFDDEITLCGGNSERVAVQLSGGLDSSAIAGSINHLRTHSETALTLSMTYEQEASWSDGPHLSAMRAFCSMEHHGIESTDHDPLAHMSAAIEALDGPCLAVGLSANLAIFQLARELGVKIVFNGHGGDEVVSWGAGRLNELAMEGRWIDLWRESRGIARITNTARWRVFDGYLLRNPVWRRLRQLVRRGHGSFGSRPQAPPAGSAEASLLSPSLDAAYPEGGGEQKTRAHPDWTERELHERTLKDALQPHSLETLTLTARHFGLDLAMPFYGRDLVEYSLSLPSDWKLRGGQTRFILSAAMRGRVPDSIITRPDKNNFAPGFIRNVLRSDMVRALTRTPSPALLDYVSAERLQTIWAKVEQAPDSVSVFDARSLWIASVLALWLDSDRDACLKA